MKCLRFKARGTAKACPFVQGIKKCIKKRTPGAGGGGEGRSRASGAGRVSILDGVARKDLLDQRRLRRGSTGSRPRGEARRQGRHPGSRGSFAGKRGLSFKC